MTLERIYISVSKSMDPEITFSFSFIGTNMTFERTYIGVS